MEEISLRQRDIVLMPFMFPDMTGSKIRPTVVLSNDAFNASATDVLVCAMTADLKESLYKVRIEPKDVDAGVLENVCCARADTIGRLYKKLAKKKIGRLSEERFHEIVERVVLLVKRR